MNNKDMAEKIKTLSPESVVNTKYDNQLEVIVNSETITSVLTMMKAVGFEHLSNLTCVDWIKENRFDVTYNLWSYSKKVHAVVKAGVNRQKPSIATIMELWPQAQVYEREIHEMFGVNFDGNPNLSPLFLHNWQDIPPLRKDFDTEAYSRKAYKLEEVAENDNGGD